MSTRTSLSWAPLGGEGARLNGGLELVPRMGARARGRGLKTGARGTRAGARAGMWPGLGQGLKPG